MQRDKSRQKWTTIKRITLDRPTKPPVQQAKNTASEVQILSPRLVPGHPYKESGDDETSLFCFFGFAAVINTAPGVSKRWLRTCSRPACSSHSFTVSNG